MKKTKNLLTVCLLAGMMFSLNACNKPAEEPAPAPASNAVSQPADTASTPASTPTSDNKSVAEDANSQATTEEAKLEDWAGTWNDMGLYLDKEEVQSAFDELAKKENKTPEEAKAEYVKKRDCEFHGLVIDANKVTFLDNFKDAEGKELETKEYTFKEAHNVKHGNFDLTWNVFEAKDEDAKYKYLLLMPVHGEDEMTHFHMRYGNDVKELLEKDNWFPTFVLPETTDDQIMDEIKE